MLIIFLVTNRGAVTIDLWPFPFMVDVPLFAVVFAALLMGVLWGGFSTWLNGGKVRRMARLKTREADIAGSENRHLKDRAAALEADARAADAITVPAAIPTATPITESGRRLSPPADTV